MAATGPREGRSPHSGGERPQWPRLTKDERDAIYDFVANRFPGMGELWPLIRDGDYQAATAMAREFIDLLSLVLAGVGWGDGDGGVELEMSEEALSRVFQRLDLDYLGRGQLTKDERDAVYRAIAERLPAMGDLWLYVQAEDFVSASATARDLVAFLQLIVDGLGWGDGGGAVELRIPAPLLRRVFGRLHEEAVKAQVVEVVRRAEMRAEGEQAERADALVLDVCRRINVTIDSGGFDP